MTTVADLGSLVDRLVPGPGTGLDTASRKLQQAIGRIRSTGVGRAVAATLRGNDWLGHPAHPIVVTVPIGAWVISTVFDVKGRRCENVQKRERDEALADGALRVGVVAALPAIATGLIQLLDTAGHARRQAALHAGLNNIAMTLFVTSLGLRRAGHRGPGFALSLLGLSLVGVSGFLGGDLAYRLGVGVRAWSELSRSSPPNVLSSPA